MPPSLSIVTALTAALLSSSSVFQSSTPPTMEARGSFEVDVQPVARHPFPDGHELGRYSLDKRYHGDLEGTGQGEMLTATTPVEGSAGYVAIERVKGKLNGREGSFVLQHRGTMGSGQQHLSIVVLKDSGTGALEGLEGELEIQVENGQHLYVLRYRLPADKQR